MKSLKHQLQRFFAHQIPKRTAPHAHKFVATIIGYEQFGIITIRWFWNLYEGANGTRSFTKFHGGEIIPTAKTDYSAAMQVDRWVYGGPLPTPIFNPLETLTFKASNNSRTRKPPRIKCPKSKLN